MIFYNIEKLTIGEVIYYYGKGGETQEKRMRTITSKNNRLNELISQISGFFWFIFD